MEKYVFDLLIVALLALFAWRGASKGLILSLCGLAAVFVAFFAAQFLSERFCVPVGNILRPIVVQTVRGADAEPSLPDAELGTYTVEELVRSIQEKGLFEGFDQFLEQATAGQKLPDNEAFTPLDSLASYLSLGIARALLFALVFLGVLLIWFLLSHALDLVFQLPILSQVNTAGGLLVGLVKGVLLTVVLVWLGQLAGLVPSPPETPLLSLFTVQRLGELLDNLPV